MNINNYLNSNFSFSKDEYELKLNYILLNTFLSLTIILLTLLSVVRFYQHNYVQTFIDFVMVCISVYSLFYIRKSKKHIQKITLFLLITFFLLISLSFFNTNMSLVGASWFIVLIISAYYLKNIKIGNIFTIASIMSTFILSELNDRAYQPLDYLYVLSPLLMASGFVYVFEKQAILLKELLENKNTILQKELQEKEALLHQAHYDNLTGLPNRILFNDRLKQAISKSKRSKKEFAVLFIDLDKFKEVNDTRGHTVGDLVLKEIASRIKYTLRKEDTVSRFGGDEFVCIIEELDNSNNLNKLAQKIIDAVKVPIVITKDRIVITCSIGISIYPTDTNDAIDLIHYTDSAMYVAKELGKDNYYFYSNIEDNAQIS